MFQNLYFPWRTLFLFTVFRTTTSSSEQDILHSIHLPGPSLKQWRLNTNFDNVDNWVGLRGHENCTQTIYEFPPWDDQEFVVALPKQLSAKQIILPRNGHFVLREGTTNFLPVAGQNTNCRAREVKFSRTTRADWFDPNNWKYHGSLQRPLENSTTFEATPHLERIPCQFDSVTFPENSTFNLKISGNVTIANFLLGTTRKSYTDVAILMNSDLGKLQFQKDPETVFSLTTSNFSNPQQTTSTPACSGDNPEITDSDQCICSHFKDLKLKRKVCRLAVCEQDIDELCPNPVTPYGFCCPICGFHLKIRHTGKLRLMPLHSKVKGEITRAELQGKVEIHMGRYKARAAHIIIVVRNHSSLHPVEVPGDQPSHPGLLRRIGKMVLRLQNILKNQESEVISVTLKESWGDLLPDGDSIWSGGDGGTSDRLQGGLGGGVITLIVFLVFVILLAGAALFIFIWNKKHGYPPITLSRVTSVFPRIPSSMRMPIVPGSGGSSTLSSSLHSFGFARFTNERGSSVTIGRSDAGEEQREGKAGKSSSIRRTEEVDDGPLPMATQEETVQDANSGHFGFSEVSYDLVAGMEGAVGGKEEVLLATPTETSAKPMPLLTIPEVVVMEVGDDDGGKVQQLVPEKPPRVKEEVLGTGEVAVAGTAAGAMGKEKVTGKGKKLIKPGFLASRLAGAYKKITLEEEEEEETGNMAEDKGSDKMGEETGKDKESKGTTSEEKGLVNLEMAGEEMDVFRIEPIPEAGGEQASGVSLSSVPLVFVEEEKIIDI